MKRWTRHRNDKLKMVDKTIALTKIVHLDRKTTTRQNACLRAAHIDFRTDEKKATANDLYVTLSLFRGLPIFGHCRWTENNRCQYNDKSHQQYHLYIARTKHRLFAELTVLCCLRRRCLHKIVAIKSVVRKFACCQLTVITKCNYFVLFVENCPEKLEFGTNIRLWAKWSTFSRVFWPFRKWLIKPKCFSPRIFYVFVQDSQLRSRHGLILVGASKQATAICPCVHF